jgi:molecular chaperone DnaJ
VVFDWLLVQVLVQVPRKLSRTQREMVAKLAETMAVDNRPSSPSLMEKMKDLFN